MSKPNKEKENFARINRLLQRTATPAVRHEFDQEFQPSVLKSTLNKSRNKLEQLRKQRVINHYQWTLLFTHNSKICIYLQCQCRNLQKQFNIILLTSILFFSFFSVFYFIVELETHIEYLIKCMN